MRQYRALWLEFRRLPKPSRWSTYALTISMVAGWVTIALPRRGAWVGLLDGLVIFVCSVDGLLLGLTYSLLRERQQRAGPANSLTLGEIIFINRERRCPDCLRGLLWRGESAPRPYDDIPVGGAIEVKCSNTACRHEFSLVEFAGNYALGMRIPRDAPERYKSRPL